jgi:iron(III) transport system permease protein
VLLYWTGPGAPPGHELVVPWRELGNTLLAAGLAAGVCIAAVMPVALLSQRYPRRWTRLLERVSYTGNALPGIVIALSLVFFGARYGGVLYQTLGLLVFAYFVRFAPQALAAVGATLRGIDPAFEEAARGLGKRPSTAFVRVTLPLLRPGVLAGAALVFLSVMKELPATLLLRPIGFDTLATEVWTHTSAAAYSDAAVPALLLIAASVPIVYPLIARRPADIGQG